MSDLEEWEEGGSKDGEEKEEEWGMSDHWLIWGTYREMVWRNAARKVVD